MKKKLLITTVCISISLFACYNFAQSNAPKDDKAEKMSLMDTKTHLRLADGYEDIKNSHKIDENLYIDLDQAGGLQALSSGKVDGFNDSEYNNFACNAIYQESANLEIGSLKPLVLIKNHKKEFFICTKDKSGKNKVIQYALNNGKWERSEKSINGKPILDNGEY